MDYQQRTKRMWDDSYRSLYFLRQPKTSKHVDLAHAYADVLLTIISCDYDGKEDCSQVEQAYKRAQGLEDKLR